MTNQKKGLLLVFGTAVISGISIFLNGISVKLIEPSALTFSKNAIVAVLLLGIIIGISKFKILLKLKHKDWLYLGLIGLIGGCVPFLLFFNGLKMIGSDAGSFLHKTMFIFVGVFALFILKEKARNRWLIFAAFMLLISNFLLLNVQFPAFNSGYLFVLTATMMWALENVISKKLLQKEMDPLILAFGRMFFGAIFITLYLIPTGNMNTVLTMSNIQWIWTTVTALMLLGYVLTWYKGLKFVPVTTASIILLLGAPITTTLNLVLLQKSITVQETAGLIIVLTCVTVGYAKNFLFERTRTVTGGGVGG
jgi:drug/metabolite transporter (DMT)-like permease